MKEGCRTIINICRYICSKTFACPFQKVIGSNTEWALTVPYNCIHKSLWLESLLKMIFVACIITPNDHPVTPGLQIQCSTYWANEVAIITILKRWINNCQTYRFNNWSLFYILLCTPLIVLVYKIHHYFTSWM